LLERGAEALAEMFIVADVGLVPGDTFEVEITPAAGEKCPRCWNYRTLGEDPAHPGVCVRCASVLTAIDR
ncbi:MAG TPA: zinc finger domain-containing protein, partial [Coriobacteriia bacterium]|nr:zinc finger domain-containing protein [Coriobacteriia bacterium]